MIALLGDLMGVKALMEDDNFSELSQRISKISVEFARLHVKYKKISHSQRSISFSDSVFAYWKDDRDGLRVCQEFGKELYGFCEKAGFPYRVFVDLGWEIPDEESYTSILNDIDPGFQKLFPVSFSVWSTFIAESAGHFPVGCYVGAGIVGKEHCTHEVKGFLFQKVH